MNLRILALALALSCGFANAPAFAAKKTSAPRMKKPKKFKPKRDSRYKDSKAAKVKPRKAAKAASVR